MLNRILTITAILFFATSLVVAQECPILNDNGSFEEMIYVPGGEPSIGITTGQISNWSASHGTADYVTSEWNWYDLEGIDSNAGHICYGNRDAHDHSEGIYTSVEILGDDDLLYTLSLDYATVCEASENGYLNIALNNKLSSEGHNYFQYPTPEVFPEYFEEIQPIERLELLPEANFDQNGYSTVEVSFVPERNFSQIWLFSEYQHDQVDFINCGLILDNLVVTASTTALASIKASDLGDKTFEFTPVFEKELDVVSYNWVIGQDDVSTEASFIQKFENGSYTICLDITDVRGACGTACYELQVEDVVLEDNPTVAGTCTYSSCLDLGGLPNITSINFLQANGTTLIIDEKTDGFYFPYCVGTASMCAGGENELGIFIEDLNNYFEDKNIEATAVNGYSDLASDLTCRSVAITINSPEITAESISLLDMLEDNSEEIKTSFDFDPSNCINDVNPGTNEIAIEVISGFDGDTNEGEGKLLETKKPFKEFFKAALIANQIEIQASEETTEVLAFQGGIYNTAGQQLVDLKDIQYLDQINIDYLPVGTYVIRLVNKENQQSSIFFKGE